MTFVERSRLAAQNAGAWLMLGFGGLFMLLNALQGSVAFVGINSAFISVGALSLWLVAAGFQRTALVLLSAGSCLVFFFAGVWFRNGMGKLPVGDPLGIALAAGSNRHPLGFGRTQWGRVSLLQSAHSGWCA
jgi:hypothetical protein